MIQLSKVTRWSVEYSSRAEKFLEKLDSSSEQRIATTLNIIAERGFPRSYGKPLRGELAGLWSYRVRAYRVLVDIQDRRLVILAVKIAHRKEVYR